MDAKERITRARDEALARSAQQRTAQSAAQTEQTAAQTAQAVQTVQTTGQTAQRLSQTAAPASAVSAASAGNYAALAQQARSAAQRNRLSAPDVATLRDNLTQQSDLAQKQAAGQIDYAVSQGSRELSRASADAQERYAAQSRQIAADGARARDNQALYNAAQGNRGGIGAAQVDAISAATATNMQSVNLARTKMLSDTARQIADLRAQGEFQKADALLQAKQAALAQLFQLEKWGQEMNLSTAQFNASMDQWLNSYLAQLQRYQVQDSQWQQSFAYQQGRDAIADARYQQEYADSRSDLAWNRQYQQGRDAVADARYAQEYADSRSDLAWNRQYQQGRDAVADNQWNQTFARQINRDAVSDSQWQQSYQLQVRQLDQAAKQFADSLNLDWAKLNMSKDQFAEQVKQWWTNFDAQQGQQTWENDFRAGQQGFNNQLTLRQQTNQERQQGIENALRQEQLSQSAAQAAQARQDALAKERRTALASTASALIGAGLVPESQEALDALGISANEASLLAQAARAGQTVNVGGKSAGKSTAATGKSMTLSDAKEQAKNGLWTDTVYNAFISNGWTDADLNSTYGQDKEYQSFRQSRNGGTGTAPQTTTQSFHVPDSEPGLGLRSFSNPYSRINEYLTAGNEAEAMKTVNAIWSRLNANQRQRVEELLRRFGYNAED